MQHVSTQKLALHAGIDRSVTDDGGRRNAKCGLFKAWPANMAVFENTRSTRLYSCIYRSAYA